MAIFKIIASRRGTEPDGAEFEIEPISGEVTVGDEFQCLERHHPIDYRVRAIQNSTTKVTLSCMDFMATMISLSERLLTRPRKDD